MTSSPERRPGLLTWDFGKPKGGLGYAMQWMAEAADAIVLAPNPAPGSSTPFLSATLRIGGHLLFSLLLPFTLHRRLRNEAIGRLLVPVGPGGMFLLRRPHVPVTALVYHTYDQQSRLVPGEWWKKIFLPFERRTLQMADSVLCFCADTQRVLIDEYGIPVHRIRLLSQGIDTAAWNVQAQKRPHSCVFVGRPDTRKGIDVLRRAWKQVEARMPEATLTIVGGAGASHLAPSDLRTLVAASEVAVCPSYLEGFGLACAEAMAAGTAVVASDCDGLRCLVEHEHTGLLVKPGDEKELAEAIIRMLTDAALRGRLAAAAQADVRMRCDLERSTRELANAVQSLVLWGPCM